MERTFIDLMVLLYLIIMTLVDLLVAVKLLIVEIVRL